MVGKEGIRIYSFSLVIHTNQSALPDAMNRAFTSLRIMLALAFIRVVAVCKIVMGRSHRANHQQLVSVLPFGWFANYVAEFITSVTAILLVCVVIHAFDIEAYLSSAPGPFSCWWCC